MPPVTPVPHTIPSSLLGTSSSAGCPVGQEANWQLSLSVLSNWVLSNSFIFCVDGTTWLETRDPFLRLAFFFRAYDIVGDWRQWCRDSTVGSDPLPEPNGVGRDRKTAKYRFSGRCPGFSCGSHTPNRLLGHRDGMIDPTSHARMRVRAGTPTPPRSSHV